MGAPKRLPSFSQRPGFPCGLRVLLVDSDPASRARTEAQLRECSYSVTSCATCAEAVVQISTCTPSAFDVLLADQAAVGCAAVAAGGRSGLLDSCRGVPCILMGPDPSPKDVMRGISLGAVDFLAKPVSQLKLRNIWQHTVRKMMDDLRVTCSGEAAAAVAAAAAAAATAAAAAAAPVLDRSASNVPEALAAALLREQQEEQQQQQQAEPAAAAAATPAPSAAGAGKPPTGLPPRSPPLRAVRGGVHRLHACISSTNLSKPGQGPADDDCDFDFEAAAAAAASPDDRAATPPSARAAPSSAAAPTASGATAATATATATATHMSVPPPSCGMPVAGALAPLAHGMVWGMPMAVVRAPGIVPPKGCCAAPAAPPQGASWGFGGCQPPMGFMPPQAQHMMMAPPPGMYGAPHCMPYGYPSAPPPHCFAPPPPLQHQQQQHQQQHQHQQHARCATGAAAAQALDASLMSLLGSAEDDEDDLEVDLDAVLGGLDPRSAPAAASTPLACAAGAGAGAAASAADAAGSPGAAASGGSLGSSRDALPRVDSAAALLAGVVDDGDADAFLRGAGVGAAGLMGASCGGLGLDDWADHIQLRKSASLADLLAGPLAVA
ncbi:hypothetical protein Rsub_10202 [Raphidocelis subcapitata]|uniref:Response regulatory domain-containing protein n=1 Tax=Raphidocelis subcapitata TaxID=307507 RepID=A0A2V0PKD2_9CHLO|nr:hypothetical protein Rsub_10202 [Raphidocelis subcapitata]|eukprot:GBF97777.1 hypothetical protein Rsub_10202 [Raphidocelis subcapitata]